MTDPRKLVFDAIRKEQRVLAAHVPIIDKALDEIGFPREAEIVVTAPRPAPTGTPITERIQLEILEHEGIVPEAYKDSVGVWTWGCGVTNASGHKVGRYKDNPTTILRCLEVYEWLIRTKYLPEVLKAFSGFPLTEAQLGGALSFHWNTGKIGKANWVSLVKAGKVKEARAAIMNWATPKEIIGRRQLERNLFFDGVWSSDGLINVYTRVRKPAYTPDWSSAKQTDVREMLRDVVARAGQ